MTPKKKQLSKVNVNVLVVSGFYQVEKIFQFFFSLKIFQYFLSQSLALPVVQADLARINQGRVRLLSHWSGAGEVLSSDWLRSSGW